MEHLNESFLAVEEHIIEATRLLGVHCMGIDPDATRREALDQLAMALTNLKTGEQDIRIPDAQAKTDFPATAEHVGSTDVQAKTASAEVGTSEPHAVFQTEKDLVAFVARATNAVNGIVHEEACRKGREATQKFAERQELKRQLLAPGEIYVESHYLEEAHESVSEILERLPDVDGNELVSEINEAAVRAWSRLSMVLRWGAKDAKEEIDTSDNERADGAQEAESSHGRVQHTAAQEGAAQ